MKHEAGRRHRVTDRRTRGAAHTHTQHTGSRAVEEVEVAASRACPCGCSRTLRWRHLGPPWTSPVWAPPHHQHQYQYQQHPTSERRLSGKRGRCRRRSRWRTTTTTTCEQLGCLRWNARGHTAGSTPPCSRHGRGGGRRAAANATTRSTATPVATCARHSTRPCPPPALVRLILFAFTCRLQFGATGASSSCRWALTGGGGCVQRMVQGRVAVLSGNNDCGRGAGRGARPLRRSGQHGKTSLTSRTALDCVLCRVAK